MSVNRKRVRWIGRAREELLGFPDEAMNKAGHNLGRVQRGADPEDWRPMGEIGPGAAEIRVQTSEGGSRQHRVIYVAKFPEAVYVLHAFEKKTRKTSPHNLDVARARYAQMLRERQSTKEMP